MDISEVRIKLMPEHATKKDKLQAFCSITIGNDFVVRDIKIIEGSKGIFVAMPSRKLTDRCVRCSAKNHLRAKFCNDCGQKLPPERAGRDVRGRAKLHADIAHPINVHCREAVQAIILGAYKQEMKRSQLPGYVPQELHALPELDEIAEGFMEEEASHDAGGAVGHGVSADRQHDERRARGGGDGSVGGFRVI